MTLRNLGRLLSVVRQGITVGADFGPRALEALLWVAESVEESVYEPGSFVHGPDGLRFALSNPPLRMGAFSSVRLRLDGTLWTASRTWLRAVPGAPRRTAESVTPERPLELRPGARLEVLLEAAAPRGRSPMRVRLELQSVAIPPLVWLEFEETPREAPSP